MSCLGFCVNNFENLWNNKAQTIRHSPYLNNFRRYFSTKCALCNFYFCEYKMYPNQPVNLYECLFWSLFSPSRVGKKCAIFVVHFIKVTRKKHKICFCLLPLHSFSFSLYSLPLNPLQKYQLYSWTPCYRP